MMYGHGKSDRSVVPRKPANKADKAAERVEERDLTKGILQEQNTRRTQSRVSVSNALERIRQVSKNDKRTRFTSLYHHICRTDALRNAFYRLKRSAKPGIDGQTWEAYRAKLDENLENLSSRLRKQAYKASPVRRVFIPKADGSQRPIGVTTLEDKLVQVATVAVLNAVYEPLFVGFSYGFRPGRNQHDALDAVHVGINKRKVKWVLDADIRGFFDTINHEHLMRLIEHKIVDPRVTRLIQKWLKAGVLTEEGHTESEIGSPQGGSVSPVLGNIYLHYAYDNWALKWRKEKAKGDAIFVRYADDSIAGFQHRADALGFLTELRSHFRHFGLELHAEKTRILEFGRYANENRKERNMRRAETFEFLGFTHICGCSRAGEFQLQRQTSGKRMTRKLREVKVTLWKRMHHTIPEVGSWLASILRGHYEYFAVPLNYRAISSFRNAILRLWHQTLKRKSQKAKVTWERMSQLAKRWLPKPRIVHPYPNQRLAV